MRDLDMMDPRTVATCAQVVLHRERLPVSAYRPAEVHLGVKSSKYSELPQKLYCHLWPGTTGLFTNCIRLSSLLSCSLSGTNVLIVSHRSPQGVVYHRSCSHSLIRSDALSVDSWIALKAANLMLGDHLRGSVSTKFKL